MNLECILGSIVVVVCIKQCSDSGSARASRSGELKIVDEHEELLSRGSGWRVLPMSVLVVASTDGSRRIALFSDLLTSLVVLGRYGLCVAARRLEILIRRCRTLLPWLWPCGKARTILLDVYSYYMVMVMAMWKEGNESPLMYIDITWLWPCDREGEGSLVVE
ncbi:hypothetical protein DEO72_LG1g2819 [Vigna unguiculata]|uniref:Uncharacterized protein n=1 Tax=Vigna unguiculata TaxID=3917 RepID=A0A4D6KR78_VIGUN|nr:hypothetical protein DEO72_LG1g2819 [Vigna unguiculata]